MADETKPNETAEERRARRIAEAKAKLAASKKAAEPGPSAAAETPDEPPAASEAESSEERRGPGTVSATAEGLIPPGARPAGETAADVKFAPEGPGGAVESLVEPGAPVEETVEQRRARKIAEARARMRGAGVPPAPPGESPVTGPIPAPTTAPPATGKTPVAKRKTTGLETVDISDDPLVKRLRKRFGDAITSAVSMLGQPIVTITRAAQPKVLAFLRNDEGARFDLLLDVTAVHRPEEEPPFEVVYQLVSVSTGRRLRVKVGLADGESIPSATPVWATANWLERECYDLFGITFEGHPDLRRILLPEGWEGHPLRKEYPVEFRENAWVRENLNIMEIPQGADFTGKFEA